MAMINFTVDGRPAKAERGRMLLPIIKEMGIDIPTLCHLDGVSPYGACRLCLVEVKERGRTKVTTSCNYTIHADGTEVFTDTERVKKLRRNVAELILARNPESEVVQKLAGKLGVKEVRYPLEKGNGKCVLCGICVRVCSEVVGVHALTFSGRGASRRLGTPFDEPSSTCIGCGACYTACPTGAIDMKEVKGIREIWGKKFEMEKCEKCGVYFAPKFQLDYFAEKFKVDREKLKVCMTCR